MQPSNLATYTGRGHAPPGAVLAALLAGLATGCGPGENDPGPGGVTVGEARALDEAAEMLDKQQAADSEAESAPRIPAND